METLTAKEYAGLRGCTVRYVRKLILEGKVKATEVFGAGGKNGLSYQILLADIDPTLQKKYMRKLAKEQITQEQKTSGPVPVKLEDYTEDERAEIAMWKDTLNEWTIYRNNYRDESGKKNMEEADELYVGFLNNKYPDMKFSRRGLQRKAKTLRERGEGALIDGRGKHDSHRKAIDEYVFGIFENFYLDESQKSIRKCMELTELQLRKREMEDLLPLASETTFAREIERSIPVPVLQFYRLGDKAMRDKCSMYIRRSYRDLNSNDIWVCDNHPDRVYQGI